MTRWFRCPNCLQLWNEYDLFHSEGDCLSELEVCGWEDALGEVTDTYNGEDYDLLEWVICHNQLIWHWRAL